MTGINQLAPATHLIFLRRGSEFLSFSLYLCLSFLLSPSLNGPRKDAPKRPFDYFQAPCADEIYMQDTAAVPAGSLKSTPRPDIISLRDETASFCRDGMSFCGRN